MSKEARNRLMYFGSWDNKDWEALGKDVDELNKELNPQTENSKNVLGEATFNHEGYEPSVEMDTYYMDPDRKLYEKMLDNALMENSDEESLVGYFAEAHFDTVNKDAGTMTGICYVRKAWFVPQSTGGNTSGFNIPFTINPIGAVEKKKISYTMADNSATITDMEAV